MDLAEIQAGKGGALGVLARLGLSALSFGYGAAILGRNALYATGLRPVRRLPVRVVSVGNLTAGGTGKTPFVAWLAKRARDAGRHVGILSRGYGPRPAGSPLSDEGTLLREILASQGSDGSGAADVPQVEDPDRVRGGLRLCAASPGVDLVLLDDGFQHRRLARDLDVVLIDATDPFGRRHLLPRGLLREPPSALDRAHAVVLTRADRVDPAALASLKRDVAERAPRAMLAVARTKPVALIEPGGGARPPVGLAGRRVVAWSAIGRPEAFEGTLADLGAVVVTVLRAPDYHAPTAAEVAQVLAEAERVGAERVVITRKDLVKWRTLPLPPDRVIALDVETEVVEGADRLVEAALGAPAPARH